MHNDDNERADLHESETTGEREEDTREAVTAADDTGLVSQQVTLVEAAIGDTDSGGVDHSGT